MAHIKHTLAHIKHKQTTCISVDGVQKVLCRENKGIHIHTCT